MSLQFLLDFASPEAHDAPIWALVSTSQVVWSGAADGTIRAWDAVTGASLGRVRSPHKAAVTSVSLSIAQGLILSGSMDGSLALWSIDDFVARQQQVPRPLPDSDPSTPPDFSESEPLGCLAFTPSVATLPFPTENKHFPIDSYVAALHPTEPVVATTGNTAALAVYFFNAAILDAARESGQRNQETSELFETLHRARASDILRPRTSVGVTHSTGPLTALGKHGWGMAIRFSPDGEQVAVGSDSGQVIVYGVDDGSVIASFSNHSAPIRALAWSELPSAESLLGSSETRSSRIDHLIVGAEDTTITVHDALDLAERQTEASDNTVAMLQGHTKMATSVAARQDGRIIASTSRDGTAKLWDLAASPKAVVCTVFEELPLWCIQWLPEPLEPESTALAGAAAGSGPISRRFLVAGDEGRVKWYRSAGATAVRDI